MITNFQGRTYAFLLVMTFCGLWQTEAAVSPIIPNGRPTTITSEVGTLVARLPYGSLIKALDEAAAYIKKLERNNYILNEHSALIGTLLKNESKTNETKVILHPSVITSLRDRLNEVFKQLYLLGVIEEPRLRQKRGIEGDIVEGALDGFGSTNIFQDTIGAVGEVVGFGSLKRIELLQHHIDYAAQHLFHDQEELTSRLGNLATMVADAVSQLDKDVLDVVRDHENNDRRRHAVVHMVTSIVDQSEAAVGLFMEIRDRADLGLPSVLTISEDTLKTFITNTTQRYHNLRPIYPDVRSYLKLPYAQTSVNNKDHVFTTVLRIPFTRELEHFYQSEKHITYQKLTSDNNDVYLSHQDSFNCHKTSSDIVCLTRPCLVNKYEDAIKTCLLTRSETTTDDIVELIYDPEYLQKNPIDEKIIVNCKGGKRKEIPVNKDVLQISLPQSCGVHNRFFQINAEITSEIPAKFIQDNEITLNFKEVSLNETEEKFTSGITIQSPATVQIVEHLRQEAKFASQLQQLEMSHAKDVHKANQDLDHHENKTLVSIISIAVIVIVIALVLFFCLYCCPCRRSTTCQ